MVANIGGELLPVLEQIERDKGIKKEDLLKMIEQALVSAFKKHSGKSQVAEAHINKETGMIEAFVIKNVVKNVEDPQVEIDLSQAQKIKKDAKIGDEIKIKIDTTNFGRIAAQTAKQVIIQRIRETEKDNLFTEFKEREGDIVNGQVYRLAGNTVVVDLGKTEGILPEREQIPREEYRPGNFVKAYVLKVEQMPRGPKIILSRTHPGFLHKLFDLEVPEVSDKTVEIKGIVREPGFRSKVAVISHNIKVDPVGACVGVKGSRIKAIIEEIGGEKIDLVLYSNDVKTYIGNALNPAKLLNIIIDQEKKKADIIVADDQLSLAIGKMGQNVRLAARLLGWHLDIKSEKQRKQDKEEKMAVTHDEILALDGIGEKTAALLVKAGYSMDRLVVTSKDELMGLQGIGDKMADKIVNAVKKYVKKKKKEK
ncbi:MAG: transcription termination factor NusA [Elusimicrobiota bacterium]